MNSLTGVIFPMPVEARAVLGRRGWRYLNEPPRRSFSGARAPTLCLCSGVGPARAEAAARQLLTQGAAALILLGVAGGLHAELRPGDLVVADAAVEVDEKGTDRLIPADRDRAGQLCAVLTAVGLEARSGRIMTVPRPVRSPEEKAGLFKRYRALTVDMESGAVLRTARAAGVPVLILRAVCDPAGQCLPEAVAHGVAADGRVRPWYIMGKLLADPSLLLALWQVNKGMGAALKSLQSAWRADLLGRSVRLEERFA